MSAKGRLCLECVHCKLEMGHESGYCSTCAHYVDTQLQCAKGHFGLTVDDKRDTERTMRTAETCPDFAPEKWAKP